MIARRLSKIGRFVRNTAGTAAIEFGLLLPVLLLVTVGIIEGGRTFLALHALEKVAGDGVRYASVRGSESPSPVTEAQVDAFVKSRAAGLVAAELVVVVDWPDGNNDPGNRVTVQVDYDHESLLGTFLGWQDVFQFQRASTLSIMR